ncbi:MAG TPA: TetR family transcriptional regulator [Streptosporangiaceae bacterium]|nr:TetR family transcriptional regulator [Streptosporangiaceae bacterium]
MLNSWPAVAEPAALTKAQRTRERIFGCAMDLFTSHGYEKTTMRMIADQAAVNVALSYHYFPSKEHLVVEFYRRFSSEFIARSAAAVGASARLGARLTAVAETMFAVADPYHGFAGSLFATAASPVSPLNPFSADCAEIRENGIALFTRVIDGCKPRVPDDVAQELPFLLWAFNLGMLYCWIHDHSEGQQKTRTILRQSVRLVVAILRLGSSPGARYFWRQVLSISHLVRSSLPGPAQD